MYLETVQTFLKKIHTSLFVQKPFLGTIYRESNFKEDIDLKNQFRIKKLPDPISITDACSKNYDDNRINDHSIIKNTAHVDFNNKNLNNVRFIKINCLPAIPEHVTANILVDQALSDDADVPSLLRLDSDEKLNKDEQDSIVFFYFTNTKDDN